MSSQQFITAAEASERCVCVHCYLLLGRNVPLVSAARLAQATTEQLLQSMHAQCRGYDTRALVDTTCPLCLGLFAPCEGFPTKMQAMLVDLQNQIRNCRFTPSSFCCVLSFPASSSILCNAAGFALRSHFTSSRVKELVREYFESNIAEFAGIPQDVQEAADLLVEITISLQQETETIGQLCEACGVPAPAPETRKKYNPQEKRNEYTKGALTIAQIDALWEKMNAEQRAKATEWLKGTRGANVLRTDFVAGIRQRPIFIAGRYRKYSRTVPQTPWHLADGRMGDLSVQELVLEPFEVLFETTNSTFHSAGREDMDVRMLGKGRPFLVELHDAKVAPSEELFAQIVHWMNTSQGRNRNGDVQIDGLVATDQHAIPLMQEGAEDKQKDYACVVWTEKCVTREQIQALNDMKDLKIFQRTPVRVAHRRSLLVRERFVHRMEATPLGPNLFILRLTTSAGTYVKEFVHGDLGRTSPSVGDLLGTRADILQLDVLDVHDGIMEEIHRRNASAEEAAAAKRARIEEQKEPAGTAAAAAAAAGWAVEALEQDPFLNDASEEVRQRWRRVAPEEVQTMRLPSLRTS